MEKSAAGGGAVATPVSELVCGEPGALSLTESVAASVPAKVGLNVTTMVHEALVVSVLPQVFVLVNAVLLVPVREMPAMVSAGVAGVGQRGCLRGALGSGLGGTKVQLGRR